MLLVGYTVHSLVLLAFLQRARKPNRGLVLWAQASDIVWPALLCLFTDPPNSVFFVFFLFAMIAAAFRWGFVETMATAEISAALLLCPGGDRGLRAAVVAPSAVHLDRANANYHALRLPADDGLSARLPGRNREGVARGNRPHQPALVPGPGWRTLRQRVAGGHVGNWSHLRQPAGVRGGGPKQHRTGVPVGCRVIAAAARPSAGDPLRVKPASVLMQGYPHTFYMQRNGGEEECSVAALDEEGRRLDLPELKHLEMPVAGCRVGSRDWQRDGRGLEGPFRRGKRSRRPALRTRTCVLRRASCGKWRPRSIRSMFSGGFVRGPGPWSGHGWRANCTILPSSRSSVSKCRSMCCAVAPRAMPHLVAQLEHIQNLLRQEVLNLRELMQTMRPIEIGPHQFLDFIAQLVERFSRDTGVEARFVSELQEVTMPPATCRELARVVQEGLVNIRKHSGAQSAQWCALARRTDPGSW